ncbi:MAG: DUF4929 family protein [Bacteroidales bacterium]|nr:DUF4929 family protein [Bacteroidales bacterium]
MKRVIYITTFILTMVIISCSNEEKVELLPNYVNLYVNGAQSITISEDITDPIEADILLTYMVDKTTTLKFTLINNDNGILRVENNIVEIAKDQNNGKLKIYSENKNELIQNQDIYLKMESSDNSRLVMGNQLKIEVLPVTIPETPDEGETDPNTPEPPAKEEKI